MTLTRILMTSFVVDFDEVPSLLKFYSFKFPEVQGEVNFINCFKMTTNSPETATLTQHLTEYRRQASEHGSSLSRVVQSIDLYLPPLFQLMVSLNNQNPVPLDAPLQFCWRSSLDNSMYTFSELVFELVMMLYLKASTLGAEGNRLLEVDPINNLSAAAQLFLSAAGILDYLGTILLPKWFPTPGVVNRRPVEASPSWCLGLAAMLEAMAQSCAVVKALHKGGPETLPSYAILTKLSSAVVDKCRLCFDAIDAPVLAFVGPQVAEFVGYQREMFSCISHYYHGELSYHADECGLAISHFRKAQSFLREQSRGPKKEPYNHFSPGLPSLVGPFLSVAPSIALLNAKIERRIAKADNDNRMIFFQDVPSDTDRPPLPAGICIMNRKTLDVGEWERAPVVIFFKV